MRFCIEAWGSSYEDVKNTCILAENLGYHGFYYGESLANIDMDCWTVLSHLSAKTNKIRLGPVITYLFPQYRSIALLAKQAITLQDICEGRLDFRTGAGAILQYASQWWQPFGIGYPNIKQRVEILNEGLQVLQEFWNGKSVFFEGNHFNMNGGTLMNKTSTKIPVTVAAKGERMMAIAAKYANVWEASYISPDKFRILEKKFKDICNREGRGKSDKIIRSIEVDVIIAESDSELEYKKKLFMMDRGPGVFNHIMSNGIVGTPENIKQKIKEYVNVGVDQFFLAFPDPFAHDDLELFMDCVK
jgi:alkanesulfonate monooxygenase SsuD/methylene tetrahydromethanopterin reductase-like flavin-dependent oxidoreductase (luciferase family)